MSLVTASCKVALRSNRALFPWQKSLSCELPLISYCGPEVEFPCLVWWCQLLHYSYLIVALLLSQIGVMKITLCCSAILGCCHSSTHCSHYIVTAVIIAQLDHIVIPRKSVYSSTIPICYWNGWGPNLKCVLSLIAFAISSQVNNNNFRLHVGVFTSVLETCRWGWWIVYIQTQYYNVVWCNKKSVVC